MNSNLLITYELTNEKPRDILEKKVKAITTNITIYDSINVFILHKF